MSVNCYSYLIYFVGSKPQAYATRPNGGLGIHWDLHIGEDENYKFLFCP